MWMLLQSLQIKGQAGQYLHFGLVRPQGRRTRRAHLTSYLHRTVRSECPVQTQSFFKEILKALTGVKIRYTFFKISKVLVVQSCSTLWNPRDYSPPGSSVHGILQARILEITSPGWMHETSAQGWCTGETQRDRMGREAGGGIGMGNTWKSMADSCQCMAKTTTILQSN